MSKEKLNVKALLLWIVIGGILGWFMHANLGSEVRITDSSTDEEGELDLALFWDVWKTVQANFYDIEHVEDQEATYGAVHGLVESLGDPYSEFMTPEESTSFQQSLDSELEGVGMELTVKEGLLVVVSPLKDSPAELAGILPGDHVYMVEGNPTSEMTLFDAIMSIRGAPGTQVTLTILREGSSDPIEMTITRAKIEVPTVESRVEERNGKTLTVVSMYQFGNDTSSEFGEAVRAAQLLDSDGMVLDLRLNGGGYLDIAVEVLGEFFDEEQKAVIVKHRNDENEVMYTNGDGELSELPLVVLIDEGSASASEIVAGALQDYKRAVLMGETSFGKGSVQELATLSDGSSLRLTIAKWFTPLDRGIDQVGITPDVEVPMEYTAIDTEEDVQMEAALNYLGEL